MGKIFVVGEPTPFLMLIMEQTHSRVILFWGKLYSKPSIGASHQISINLTKWFYRRFF